MRLAGSSPPWLSVSLTVAAQPATPASVTFAHFNDVYEIDAVEGGRSGGLSRVATVLQRAPQDAPRRWSRRSAATFCRRRPSGTARVDGEPMAGRQMVDVLNAIGVDWATLRQPRVRSLRGRVPRAARRGEVPDGLVQRDRRLGPAVPGRASPTAVMPVPSAAGRSASASSAVTHRHEPAAVGDVRAAGRRREGGDRRARRQRGRHRRAHAPVARGGSGAASTPCRRSISFSAGTSTRTG